MAEEAEGPQRVEGSKSVWEAENLNWAMWLKDSRGWRNLGLPRIPSAILRTEGLVVPLLPLLLLQGRTVQGAGLA